MADYNKNRKAIGSPNYMEFGKVPPQSVDFEEAVLGAIMIESDAFYQIIDLLKPESFYKDEHQMIFSVLLDMHNEGKDIDILTVAEELKKREQIDIIGGPLYITKLTGQIASTSHIVTHAMIVQQKYVQREVIRTSSELNKLAFDEDVDVSDLLDYTNLEIAKINELLLTNKTDHHVSLSLKKAKEELFKREINAKKNILNGIKTPLNKLDDITNGWQPGLVILAARPSMGKTQLLIEILKACALSGEPCTAFSLEMSAISLANRLITSCGEINLHKFNSGLMDSESWGLVNREIKVMDKLPIYIDDYSKNTVSRIKTIARIHKKKLGIKLIIIDFLTFIKIESTRGYEKRDELGKITKELKDLSKELSMPVILLAQLNRQVENRGGDHKPKLSDLKETGEIEEDADLVIFIHRPEYYKLFTSPTGEDWRGYGELIIAKHRDGALADIPFRYDPGIRNIRDYTTAEKKGIKAKKENPANDQTAMDLPLREDEVEMDESDDIPF